MSPASNRQFKNKAGFTLIELLIVIAVIGILSGMVMVSFDGAKDKARIAKSLQFSNSVQNAIGVDMVGRWNFEKIEGGKVIDTSGYGNDGVVHGATLVSGLEQLGNALSFDGNDWVDCGNRPSLNFGTGDFTAEYWIYYTGSTAINQTKPFLGKASAGANNPGWYSGLTTYGGNGTNLKLLSSITNGAWGTGNLEYGAYFSPNTWQHVVLVRSGNTLKHYRNGNLDGQRIGNDIGANVNNNLSFAIGAYSNGTNPVDSLIDDVRIYSSALSSSAIRENYLAGLDKLLARGQITEDDYQQRIAELNSNYVARK